MKREQFRELIKTGDKLVQVFSQNKHLLIGTEHSDEERMVLNGLERSLRHKRSHQFIEHMRNELLICLTYWKEEAPQPQEKHFREQRRSLGRSRFMTDLGEAFDGLIPLIDDKMTHRQMRTLKSHFQGRIKALLNQYLGTDSQDLTDTEIDTITAADLISEPGRRSHRRSNGKRQKEKYSRRGHSSRRNRR